MLLGHSTRIASLASPFIEKLSQYWPLTCLAREIDTCIESFNNCKFNCFHFIRNVLIYGFVQPDKECQCLNPVCWEWPCRLCTNLVNWCRSCNITWTAISLSALTLQATYIDAVSSDMHFRVFHCRKNLRMKLVARSIEWPNRVSRGPRAEVRPKSSRACGS